LIAIALPALVTAAALAPVAHGRTLGQLQWRLTMQANELPVIVAAWVVADTALAAVQGDLGTPGGIVGLAGGAATLVGVAVVFVRALRTRTIAEDALGRISAESVDPIARRRASLRNVIVPFALRRRDVVRRADIAYGPAGRENLLDVYLPRSGAATGPCLVYFHGGGYASGRKNREARALIYRLASQGWLCVSANYRLARTAPYPAALVDAKRVIAWTKEHAPDVGADPSAVFVAGSSAGAHLAAMVALTPNASALQPGFEAADTRVSGAICLYGFYGAPTWIERAPGTPQTPIDEIDRDAPPMMIVHGVHDSFVPVRGAREFAARLRAVATAPMVYLELPGAQHTFDLYDSVRFHAVVDAVEKFCSYVRDAHPASEVPRRRAP
jgi:acetyl esterase/lipase